MCICVYTHIYLCMYVCIYTHIMYSYIYVYIYMYSYVCIYIYICILQRGEARDARVGEETSAARSERVSQYKGIKLLNYHIIISIIE